MYMWPQSRCSANADALTAAGLSKMAYHPPKFPTERRTEQLLALAERIGSPTQIRQEALAECVR
jgi:hypothetical protein